MRQIANLALLASAILWAPASARADGSFFWEEVVGEVMEDANVSQSAQQALILWNEGVERLNLRSNYRGPAKGFSWVIPIPTRPKVERSSWSFVKAVEERTRPVVRIVWTREGHGSSGLGCGCGSAVVKNGGESAADALATMVTTLESLDIEELHVDIVSAKDGGGFIAWLKARGYAVPEKATTVLQEYIDSNFFFVAVKIRDDQLGAVAKSEDGDISVDLTPLAVVFEAPKPFFPLKISSVTSAPENELLLLVVAAARMEPAEYETVELSHEHVGLYARRIEDGPSGKRSIDLAPAVREAQKSSPESALVLECARHLKGILDNGYWQGWRAWQDELPQAWAQAWASSDVQDGVSGQVQDRVMVTRYHAFLTPEAMRDISFTPSEDQVNLWGVFDFGPWHDFGIDRRAPVGACVSWALVLAALSCFGLSRRERQRRGLRKLALGLLLAAACVM